MFAITVCIAVYAAGLEHAGQLLTVVASVLALCVWGFAVWWLAMAISCIADTVRQGIPFSLGWWGSGAYARAINTARPTVWWFCGADEYSVGAFVIHVQAALHLQQMPHDLPYINPPSEGYKCRMGP